MQIEFGKFYRTRDGEKMGPAERHLSDIYPWEVGGDAYTSDGFFLDGERSHRDLVAEWTEATPAEPAEIGTLKELNVQPGDVVEWTVNGVAYKIEFMNTHSAFSGDARFALDDGLFRIVSRATPTEPASEEITWGEWGPPSDGAADGDYMERCINGKTELRYPVSKQPVVETVTLGGACNGFWSFGGLNFAGDTARITFDVIDGKPDWSTLRGEDL